MAETTNDSAGPTAGAPDSKTISKECLTSIMFVGKNFCNTFFSSFIVYSNIHWIYNLMP